MIFLLGHENRKTNQFQIARKIFQCVICQMFLHATFKDTEYVAVFLSFSHSFYAKANR